MAAPSTSQSFAYANQRLTREAVNADRTRVGGLSQHAPPSVLMQLRNAAANGFINAFETPWGLSETLEEISQVQIAGIWNNDIASPIAREQNP